MNTKPPLVSAVPRRSLEDAAQRMSLEDVVLAALSDAKTDVDHDSEGLAELADLPTRFPVQVDLQTRVYLDYYARALGTSIASLAGLILNQAVAKSLAPPQRRSTGKAANRAASKGARS